MSGPYREGTKLARAYEIFQSKGAEATFKLGVEEVGLNPATLKIWVPLWSKGITKRGGGSSSGVRGRMHRTRVSQPAVHIPVTKFIDRAYDTLKEAQRGSYRAGYPLHLVEFYEDKTGKHRFRLNKKGLASEEASSSTDVADVRAKHTVVNGQPRKRKIERYQSVKRYRGKH